MITIHRIPITYNNLDVIEYRFLGICIYRKVSHNQRFANENDKKLKNV